MEHLKAPTTQPLVISGDCTAMVAGVMLSHDNRLGFVPLAVAALCGIGAFAKLKNR